MANPQLGEVSFECNGKTYILKMGTYAQAVLERRVKMPITKFVKRDNGEWGKDDLLSMFWAGLFQRYKLTEEEVAEIMDQIGDEKVAEILVEAFGVAEPKGEALEPIRPRKAKASGIGTH